MENTIKQLNKTRITFHITDICNMACKYCYETKGNKIINVQYAKDLIDEIIKFLTHPKTSFLYGYLNCEVDSIIELDFIGGEATIRIDIIDEICDYFLKKCIENNLTEIYNNVKIILQTNGTTYFNEGVQNFFNKYSDKIIYPITLDGCKECHNTNRLYKNGNTTFDDVDKATKDYIKKYDIPDTKMTFSPNTLKYIKASCEYLWSLGYKTCRINTDITKKLSIKETEQYYNSLIETADWIVDNKIEFVLSMFLASYTNQKIYGICGMAGNQLAIDMDGNLYCCFRFAEPSIGNKKMPIGSIITKTIDFNLVNSFLDALDTRTNPQCAGCPIVSGCEECPAENLNQNNSIYKSFNNCGQTIAQAKAQKYFLQRVKETNYPYFKEELNKIKNMYTDDFEYLLNSEIN